MSPEASAWPQRVDVLVHRLLTPASDDPFADESANAARPGCLRGCGRGRYAPASTPGITLLASLRGNVEVHSGDGVFRLRRHRFLCLPNASLSVVVSAPGSDWMALRLPQPYFGRILRSRTALSAGASCLLPACQPLTRPLLRALCALLRSRDGNDPIGPDVRIAMLLELAVEAQTECSAWVARAYGRSDRHRRGVVMRLLSARNRIVNAPFLPHTLGTLAAAARYSPSHFLRSFRDVFGMTPRELLTATRLAMACELMRGSDLAICEIASTVGYESPHAFSRLFKRQTGSTASDFRGSGGIAASG